MGEVFRQSVAFIGRNTKVGWEKLETGGRKELRAYPLRVVREALINAIAHRDYSVKGSQIDVDIFDDRMDITSPGSWLLPKPYESYEIGTIPSIRRNGIICACLDVANLMERGGTGFSTIVNSYSEVESSKQPVVLSFPGYFIIRLYDLMYEEDMANGNINNEMMYKGIFEKNATEYMTNQESETGKVLDELKRGPKTVRELQEKSIYKSRGYFNEMVLKPLLEDKKIIKIGKDKSPKVFYVLKREK